jgi:c-di-GMP-binding flagellar brake protein YcgR
MLDRYFDEIVKGTEVEDSLVIIQSLKQLIGQSFSILGYYKEIPVSYDARLLSIENEMAEFEVHEYQAKVINMERRALIYAHAKCPFKEDLVAEAFYVNTSKKRVILCKFGYAKILSNNRRFVRVELVDPPVEVELIRDGEIVRGNVKDISLGGAAVVFNTQEKLAVGPEFDLFLKLQNTMNNIITEVRLTAKIIKIVNESAPFLYVMEFNSEKISQQQIAYFINQRQVEIIKELKDLVV